MEKHDDIEHRVGLAQENKGNDQHGYRVLLADDDYEMRKLIAWWLNKQGYTVTECRDGNALMKKIEFSLPYEDIQHFDLIISDIRMPGSTGLQFLESVRDLDPLPPIILITAFPDDKIKDKAKQLGAEAVLEKPFDVDALMEEVRRILPLGLSGVRPSPDPALQHYAPLSFPINITFRHGKSLDPVNVFIRDMAFKLNPFADNIKQVHVVVEDLSPEAHRRHRYHISVQVEIGDNRPIVVMHDTGKADSHENLYSGIRIAFGMARRKVRHSLGKQQSKKVKRRGASQQDIIDELGLTF